MRICEILDGYKLYQVLSVVLTTPFKYLINISWLSHSGDILQTCTIHCLSHLSWCQVHLFSYSCQTTGVTFGHLNLSHSTSSLSGNISFIFKVYPESNHLILITSAMTILVGTNIIYFLQYDKFSLLLSISYSLLSRAYRTIFTFNF